jgi:hypothetical protein
LQLYLPWLSVDPGAGHAEELVAGDAEEEADERSAPLQKPSLHLLNAHCWSLVQVAWKFPQTVCNIEFVA